MHDTTSPVWGCCCPCGFCSDNFHAQGTIPTHGLTDRFCPVVTNWYDLIRSTGKNFENNSNIP